MQIRSAGADLKNAERQEEEHEANGRLPKRKINDLNLTIEQIQLSVSPSHFSSGWCT
jgi:hypothetical protein